MSQETGIPLENIVSIRKYAQLPISLETPIGQEEGSELGNFVEDKNSITPDKRSENAMLRDSILDSMDNLNEREQMIIKLRFGIDDGRQRTLDIRYTEDPLHVADKLGRPVAILRIGSRYPQLNARTGRFMFSSPPIQIIATPLLPAANTSASAGFKTPSSTNVAPITRATARPVSFPIPR